MKAKTRSQRVTLSKLTGNTGPRWSKGSSTLCMSANGHKGTMSIDVEVTNLNKWENSRTRNPQIMRTDSTGKHTHTFKYMYTCVRAMRIYFLPKSTGFQGCPSAEGSLIFTGRFLNDFLLEKHPVMLEIHQHKIQETLNYCLNSHIYCWTSRRLLILRSLAFCKTEARAPFGHYKLTELWLHIQVL